jgi:aspartokinase-like uncharacterized kinase
MRVVKVGGSLYDWPELGERLRRWLASLDEERTILVPGGGPTTEAIRGYDTVHHLGEEASHWLALKTLSVNAYFLAHLLPGVKVVGHVKEMKGHLAILDVECFARDDEAREGKLPASWDVTSDSLALRVAEVAGAKELVLLKSVEVPDPPNWEELGRRQVIDGFFGKIMARLPGNLRVRVVNLRKESFS